jgi:GNAT superfamily N-acetyltransferase
MWFTRRLFPIDLGRYRDHLQRLSADDRALRFGGFANAAVVRRHVTGLDWTNSVLIGGFVDGALRASVLVVGVGAPSRATAELAIVVETAYRRCGHGTTLVRRAITVARNRGIDRLIMHCVAGNIPVRRLVRRFEPMLQIAEGSIEARLEVGRPNHLTMLQEAMDDTAGMAGAWLHHLTARG